MVPPCFIFIRCLSHPFRYCSFAFYKKPQLTITVSPDRIRVTQSWSSAIFPPECSQQLQAAHSSLGCSNNLLFSSTRFHILFTSSKLLMREIIYHNISCISCRFHMDMDHYVQLSCLRLLYQISSVPDKELSWSLHQRFNPTLATRRASQLWHLPYSCKVSLYQKQDLHEYPLPSCQLDLE